MYDNATVDSDLVVGRYRAIIGLDRDTGKITGWEFDSTASVGKYTVTEKGQKIEGKAVSPDAGILRYSGTMKPTEDIQPLTVFRAKVASFVDQVRETRRPLYLTQHGKSAAVLLSTAEYEALVEELETLRDVQTSERELAEGRGVPHEQVAEELREIVRARSQSP